MGAYAGEKEGRPERRGRGGAGEKGGGGGGRGRPEREKGGLTVLIPRRLSTQDAPHKAEDHERRKRLPVHSPHFRLWLATTRQWRESFDSVVCAHAERVGVTRKTGTEAIKRSDRDKRDDLRGLHGSRHHNSEIKLRKWDRHDVKQGPPAVTPSVLAAALRNRKRPTADMRVGVSLWVD